MVKNERHIGHQVAITMVWLVPGHQPLRRGNRGFAVAHHGQLWAATVSHFVVEKLPVMIFS